MRRLLLGLVLSFAVVTTIACESDKPCREGTVSVTVIFSDAPGLVDGLALRYQLDDGPVVDLKPILRPTGASQGTLALELKNYASHKELLLLYAPRKGEQIVDSWQEYRLSLDAGCSSFELGVWLRPDGGRGLPDGAGAMDSGVDRQVPDVPNTNDSPIDSAHDLATADHVDSQPDVPLPSGPDASTDLAITQDSATDRIVLGLLDAAVEGALDSSVDGSDRGLDSAPGGSLDLAPSGCLIQSGSYGSGDQLPGSPCQTCQPTVSTSAWTKAANGIGCGTGQVCADGLCRPGCWIEGTFQQSAATKPGNNCQFCNPSLSVSAWTVEDDGKSCGNSQGCKAGQCGSGCWIDSVFYTSGASLTGNPCQTCQPGTSTSAWTQVPSGGACGSNQVCNAGTCQAGCWIDGAYQPANNSKAGNACQTCQPSASVSSWSNASNGTSCGTGQVCSSGTCQPGCWIGSSYYATAATKTGNTCQSCQPTQSASAWTNASDGTSCGTGQVCSAGACQNGCWIGSTFYAQGTDKPGNACQSCQPGTSTTAWTNKGDGTNCGNGQGCTAGTCGVGCNIGGTFYATGTAKPGNECQSCQPGGAGTSWSDVASGTACGTNQVCSGGACGDCVPGTTKCKDANVQQICQTGQTWTDNTTCTYGCNAGNGICYPDCSPGSKKCSSGQPQQCDATGHYQNMTACSADYQCVGAGTCLKKNAVACSSSAECAAGVCSTFYRDADGDGYPGTAATLCGSSPPAGYSTSSTDCCDSDANARPSQMQYFSVPRSGCGGYDYNCANGDELGDYSLAAMFYPCNDGWYVELPGCGGVAWYGTQCDTGGVGYCFCTDTSRVQTCR